MKERGLLERALYGILALAVLVLGFFFLAAALVLAALFAGAVLLRLWWLKRRIRREADAEFITTDYTVIERESSAPRLPPRQ
jgi:hypothetical protein